VEQAVFLPRSSIFMVGKAQKSHGARSGLYGVPPMSVSASIATFQSRNADAPLRFSVIIKRVIFNDCNSIFENWVEHCKKCVACQGRYFEKETVTAPPQRSDSE
jgi:hypothetical protein